MAAALAQRRWSGCKIQSAGISVLSAGQGAAYEAAAAMRRRGIDIGAHKATSIGDVDIHSFAYIVAMDGAVPHVLHAKGVNPSKVREALVDDPIGRDAQQYEACACAIEAKLDALVF
jgi:protein-tyrosine-phosphatase